jgi:lactobin A/cerein 7B family class IIb bacteriocin
MLDTVCFDDLTQDQIMSVNGGAIPFVVGIGIGVVVSWVADGVLIATTGKSGGEWIGLALNPPPTSGYNATGYRGGISGGTTHSSGGSNF